MPELEALAPELQQRGVGVLALSVAPEEAPVRAEAAKLSLKLPVARTEQEMLAPNALKGVPSMLFVDAQGNVVDARNGGQSAARVRDRALRLVR